MLGMVGVFTGPADFLSTLVLLHAGANSSRQSEDQPSSSDHQRRVLLPAAVHRRASAQALTSEGPNAPSTFRF